MTGSEAEPERAKEYFTESVDVDPNAKGPMGHETGAASVKKGCNGLKTRREKEKSSRECERRTMRLLRIVVVVVV